MDIDTPQQPTAAQQQQAIHTDSLSFTYGGPLILNKLKLSVPRGARCLLVGSNGAGKTTLLRILAGKRLVRDDVLVKGQHAYFNTPDGITYLGPEWVQNPVTKRDLQVSVLLESHNAGEHPDRLAALLHLLEVDPTWRTHQISDGQRRRVQILLGLLNPFDILLLDEVTVDLDVLVRRDLLAFIRRECEVRGATVILETVEFNKLIQRENLPQAYDSPLLRIKERTKWDDLKDDMKVHGDKYYNYWYRADPY
ncbi:P-loop containing nucleoside triphosphate hydrolase protein [Catenaria anguillulae PL171]|uniref:p-loop containing nucleoside triphosphate hydrolase protein n=1 Tax=Catenaria anguillulae PL171 TaxID=765915 RepID=A0A1Y2I1W4_9FUNG|nr:P-loop containing nucleoside triphosphate hydrolase protein [Catenaria anguillulae PL171]